LILALKGEENSEDQDSTTSDPNLSKLESSADDKNINKSDLSCGGLTKSG